MRQYVDPGLVSAASTTVGLFEASELDSGRCVDRSSDAGDDSGGEAVSTGGASGRRRPAEFLRLDSHSLAYACLLGRMYMLHKSMAHYPAVYISMLREYSIVINERHYMEDGRWYRKDDAVMALAGSLQKQVKGGELEVAADLRRQAAEQGIISEQRFKTLKAKQGSADGVNSLERQLLWEYMVVVQMYAIPEQLADAAFMDAYVQSYLPSTTEQEVMCKHLRLTRLWAMCNNDRAGLESAYRARVQNVAAGGATAYDGPGGSGSSHNGRRGHLKNTEVALFRTSAHQFYPVAIHLRQLLDLVTPGWPDRVSAQLPEGGTGWTVSSSNVLRALKAWVDGFASDEEYAALLKSTGLKPEKRQSRSSRAELQQQLAAGSNPASTATRLLKKLLMLGVNIECNLGGGNCTLVCTAFTTWKQKRTQSITEFAFIEDEE